MPSNDAASSEIETIGQSVLTRLDAQNQLRDRALNEGRQVIRLSANSIRSTHRHEFTSARTQLQSASSLLSGLLIDLESHPGIRWAGYVQDPMKEFAEASITLALVTGQRVPGPDMLGVDDPPYLNGLAESASELRRQILDAIRHDDFARGESLLASMDEIYGFLVTVDFPDGLTGGLRRTTDALRAVLERTRGDLTVTGAQRRLLAALGQPSGNADTNLGRPSGDSLGNPGQ
jgi:translin